MKISGLCAVALGTLALGYHQVEAAVAPPAKTKGNVNFVVPSDYEDIIKPGTNDPIEFPDQKPDQQTQVGGVQLLHTPNFNFGENPLAPQGKDFTVQHETYTEGGKNNPGTTGYAIPQFVQVGDFSGKVGTAWKVDVEQDAIFADTAKSHSLKASRINIYGETLTNNFKQANVANMVTGISVPANGKVTIPVNTTDTTGPITVLSSKELTTEEGTTNATTSSVVFKKDYKEADYGSKAPAAPAVNSRHDGVKLNVPAADSARLLAYETDLTWTLTAEPKP